jgi:hypothetical protein
VLTNEYIRSGCEICEGGLSDLAGQQPSVITYGTSAAMDQELEHGKEDLRCQDLFDVILYWGNNPFPGAQSVRC